jgi:cbb3-type cytochrome oxidase maturation protein
MLIPVALFLGLIGLAGFLWALKTGQFEDLDGAANRILFDDDDMGLTPTPDMQTDRPTDIPPTPRSQSAADAPKDGGHG